MELYRYETGAEKRRCAYFWFKDGKQIHCGKEAVRQAGRGKIVTPLCQEHFDYIKGMEGKHDLDIKVLKKGKRS